MIAPVRKKTAWLVLVSFSSTIISLNRKSAPPKPYLPSLSLMTSALWHESDVVNAVDSKTSEVEVHLPEKYDDE